jgi:2-dehydropantoate 2-reductase
MKIAIVGAGAMGGVFGAHLTRGGNDVTLVDVVAETVDALNRGGLRLQDKSGEVATVPVRATTDPADVGPADVVVVFVKCYHTEAAVRAAEPMLREDTVVLSLQNGWGNAPRIQAIVGEERVLAGVTYNSGTVLGPGHVHHAGRGVTFMGELNGGLTDRLARIVETFNASGLETVASPNVLKEIWSKLALNVCTLPTSAILRFYAGQLVEHEGTLELMRALLRETVAVANAQEIGLDEAERWEAITGLLSRAQGAKASMLQDVENGRRTEIDVVNGAIVDAGRRLGIPTPHNETMVWLVRSIEGASAR